MESDRRLFNWARARRLAGVSELAVMTPIIPGRIPGERRTYEERLRETLASLNSRALSGLPTELDQIGTFHFARVLIIRPEHYLLHSSLPNSVVPYQDESARGPVSAQNGEDEALVEALALNVPEQIDPYDEAPEGSATLVDPQFRSWLLTLVIFDGDPIVYLREIAEFIEDQFDRVFENCEDYPRAERFEPFLEWIRRYQISPDVFYTPYPHLSVARIKQLEEFKRQFDLFVAKVRSPTGKLVESMDELFDEFLRENQQYSSGFPAPGGVYTAKDGKTV